MKKNGIYRISTTKSAKVYIGKSDDINRRWGEHKRNLRANKHRNKELQHSWNLYGESTFKFEILEICSEDELAIKELDYIVMHKPNVFNVWGIKDDFRYRLCDDLLKMGFTKVIIDYNDQRVKSWKNKNLHWSLMAEFGKYRYYIQATAVGKDYPMTDAEYANDAIRNNFIESNRKYRYSKITWSREDNEEDLEQYIKTVLKDIDFWIFWNNLEEHGFEKVVA